MTNPYSRPSLVQLSLPASLSLLALVLSLLPELHQTLDWSRVGIDMGEYWRVFSGHLLHSNSNHLWLNLGGMWLIFALHQPHYRPIIIWPFALTTMLLISLGMYWGVPTSSHYVGLSALLHGLFTWGALQDIRHRFRSGWLLLIGVIIKVLWENTVGASTSVASLIEARVAVESHLLGVLVAVLLFALYPITTWCRNCHWARH